MNNLSNIKNQKKQTSEGSLHLKSYITVLQDIVFELDGNQVFKKVWVKDESILFMPIKDLLGKSVYEIMGDMSDLFSSAINESIVTGEPREVVYQHLDPAIHQWFKLRIKPVTITEKPEDCLLILIIEDITAMKQNELALVNAKKQAEKELRSKSDFLSVMSHEIRTPLNGIIGIANLLKFDHHEGQAEYINGLLFSANHLMELVNNILDYTKIENDKLELVYTEVNLCELVTNIASQFKAAAHEKGLKLKNLIDTEVPLVHADPVRLSQMLNNLINNSLKFTANGTITITMKLLKVNKKSATVQFSVKDTGMGIPDTLKETVFESFVQGRRAGQTEESGTGLGLSITQKLAVLHNSQVFFVSRVGSGSEFYFDVAFDLINNPRPHGTQQNQINLKTPGQETKGSENLNGLRVLVVDDNPINVMVACKQLLHYGADVKSAKNGEEVISMIKEQTFDVALIDLHMPDMDGYELSARIKSTNPEIHIVIFTADIMADVKVRLAQIGVYDILSKPFYPKRLFEILNIR